MNTTWGSTTIGELSELITKGTTPTSVGFKFEDNGINFVKVESLTADGKFIYKKFAHINGKCHEALKRSKIKAGDILFSIAGALGRTALVVPEILPANTNQALAIIRLKQSDEVVPRYVLLALSSGMLLEQIEKQRGGVAQQNLSLSQVKNFQIPLPALPEQKRIVAILDEAFASIGQAVANTEKNLANARELFESYLNNVFAEKGNGWVEKSLGDQELLLIIDGDRGKNYPSKTDFFDDGYCLFLNTKNVRPDGFNFDSTMFITEKKDEALRKGKLQRRDIVLTTRGTIGNIAIYVDTVAYDHIRINSGMLIFRPNESVITSEYLFEVMRSSIIKRQINKFVSGAAQPQLPIKTLVNFIIPVPNSIKEQGKIVSCLRVLSKQTKHLETIYQQKLTALAELKQSALQKAFNGELTADTVRQQVNG